MSGIFWRPEEASLKSFRSTTSSSGASTIVITLSIDEPRQLGHLLSDLRDIQREQDAAKKKVQKQKKNGSAPLALPKPVGLITYGDNT